MSITDMASTEDNEPPFQGRGQRGPENAILQNLLKVRDRAATLQSDVARLNAVDPNFTRVDKSLDSLFVAVRWVLKAFEVAVASVSRKETLRTELTLEFGYNMVLDLRRKVPTIHQERTIEEYIRKHQDQIYDAYNRMPHICSMRPAEIAIYRDLWLYTAVLIRRSAIQPRRHAIARKIFDLRVAGELDDNDAYYLARFLESQAAAPEPKYHIASSHFRALQAQFLEVKGDLNKAIEAMRSFRSTPDRQTIEKRDVLKKVFGVVFDRLKALDIDAQVTFARRPAVFWDHLALSGNIQP